MTRETVPTPTPASCATLAMVVTPPAPPRGTASIQSRRARHCQRRRTHRGSYAGAPWLLRVGGATASCTRSTRAPSATRTATAIGDLRGITARLDHLEWLGVDGIWLNPTFPSPNDDWGYDVSDYKAVHPDLGTLEDLDELIAEAGRRGIRVLLDLVPNHTSDRHAWFQDALGGRDARHRDFYVWADPADGGGPPNNWLSNFGGSAWTLHEPSGPVLPQPVPADPARPQLVERGAARGDRRRARVLVRPRRGRASGSTSATRSSRTASCATTRCPEPDDHPHVVKRGLKQVYSMNRPELHDVLRRWRALAAAPRRRRAGARGGDLRARPRAADPVLRARRGRAAPRVQLPVLPLRPRPGADAPDRRGHGARCCPRARGRCGRAPTTTASGSRPAGRAAIPRARARR